MGGQCVCPATPRPAHPEGVTTAAAKPTLSPTFFSQVTILPSVMVELQQDNWQCQGTAQSILHGSSTPTIDESCWPAAPAHLSAGMKTSFTAWGTTRDGLLPFTACLLPATPTGRAFRRVDAARDCIAADTTMLVTERWFVFRNTGHLPPTH